MKIFGKIAYNGTNYLGWQRQNESKTIQGILEDTLTKILNENIVVCGSGRTDAGVHASGQTFHFEVNKTVDISHLKYSVNCLLPNDIHILELKEVSDDFHARFSAKGKHYSYTIILGENDPFNNTFAHIQKAPIDIELFKKAIKRFDGQNNFQNFTSKQIDDWGFIRNVQTQINIEGNKVVLNFYGNGFMKYMIRFMVGTALEVARGKENIAYIDENLNSKERKIVRYKAPSCGLKLEEVIY